MSRISRAVLIAAAALVPGTVLAGIQVSPAVPTLGEVGLVTFAVGLVGGGFVLLRRRGK